MKRMLASAALALALTIGVSAVPSTVAGADTTASATTRYCSSATTYNIRSIASASGSLVKAVGMKVSLTVNAVARP